MEPDSVREIQEALRTIAFYDSRYKRIAVDGIYGPDTTEAVIIYQRLQGKEPSGVVDPATFDEFINIASKLNDRSVQRISVLMHPNEQIRPLEKSDRMIFIKQMLHIISKAFANISDVEVNDEYDEETAEVIKKIQKKHALPESGTIDKDTWNILADLYEQSLLVNADVR